MLSLPLVFRVVFVEFSLCLGYGPWMMAYFFLTFCIHINNYCHDCRQDVIKKIKSGKGTYRYLPVQYTSSTCLVQTLKRTSILTHKRLTHKSQMQNVNK